jgi:hypothetical protein
MVGRDMADGVREHQGAHHLAEDPDSPLAGVTFGARHVHGVENRQVVDVETGAVLGLDVVALAGSVRSQGGRAAPPAPISSLMLPNAEA